MKVFSGGPDFKSLKREIDVVRSLPHHENIVRLFSVEEDVSFCRVLVGCQGNTVHFQLVVGPIYCASQDFASNGRDQSGPTIGMIGYCLGT